MYALVNQCKVYKKESLDWIHVAIVTEFKVGLYPSITIDFIMRI